MSYSARVSTNSQPLNMRSGPGTNFDVIGSIPIGTSITVDDYWEIDGGWRWAALSYNGQDCYCCIQEPGADHKYIDIDYPPPPITTSTDSSYQSPLPDVVDTSEQDARNQALINGLLGGGANDYNYEVNHLDDSGVQYASDKYGSRDVDYVDKYLEGDFDEYEENTHKEVNNNNEPKYVQNQRGFPSLVGRQNGFYTYNYYQDTTEYDAQFEAIRNNLNFPEKTRREAFLHQTKYYNRFKVAERENQLSKSYAHVFFIRPDLNVMTYAGGGEYELTDMVKNNANYYYASQHCPEVLRELIHTQDGRDDDFMWLLSNAAASFEVSDEYISTDTYGENFRGHKIPYGKSDTESKSANTLNITYEDDRDLHIYHLHKVWIDYISNMYYGKFRPRDNYANEKILDYASAAYFIVTAEDGETIIFWSKYYGIFPTNAPSSTMSYQKNSLVKVPSFTINYTYAFKEDFNPLTLVEFNMHSPQQSVYKYAKTYQKTLLGTGKTWVGAPFIETFTNQNGMDIPYTFKLRFRKGK